MDPGATDRCPFMAQGVTWGVPMVPGLPLEPQKREPTPMSWLSKFSLAQRALIGLMSIIALVFGAIAIPQLKQQLLPSIELPLVSVLAPYQGASPDVVEKQVVEPLEDNLEAVDGITGVTSTASEGNAVIMATFDFGDEGTK